MEYTRALELAVGAKELLAPFTERCEIAGGIRRGKLNPHDIELVAIPKPNPEFGAVNALDKFIWECLLNGHHFEFGDRSKDGKKPPTGPRYYRLKFEGEKCDIFSVFKPAQWGTVFTIRTGDAQFSHRLVQKGYPKGIHEVDGHLELVKDNYGKGPLVTQPFNHDRIPIPYQRTTIDTPEEADVFKVLGIEWVPPFQRVTTETTKEEWEATAVHPA